jgi:hypothetical protein
MAKFFGDSFSRRHRIVDLNSGAHWSREILAHWVMLGTLIAVLSTLHYAPIAKRVIHTTRL